VGLGRILKVLHIITGLEAGGAEAMLLKLLTQFKESGPGSPDAEVISLSKPGPMGPPIRKLGIPVTSLGMSVGPSMFWKLNRLRKKIIAAQPDVIQTWMYHANFLGGIAAAAGVKKIPLIWGLRQSNLDPRHSKKSAFLSAWLGAKTSDWLPDSILCVSQSARHIHEAMGYCTDKLTVIPNGFDFRRFHPDPAARQTIRKEIEAPLDAPLVGLFARFNPQKDHRTFLRAAALLHERQPNVKFVMCGTSVKNTNSHLRKLIWNAGLSGSVYLLGLRNDIPRLTASLDVAVSSSAFGEGYSNTIGEALATGIPVAATDVGDSASIVGENGKIVVPEDPDALAGAMLELLCLPQEAREKLSGNARQAMEQKYSIKAIADQYRALYDKVTEQGKVT
jgi:glycosyltransferase involved in cell wall biosynthesis